MFALSQYFIKTFRPWLYACLTRVVYFGGRVTIGAHFRCDGIPRIVVDPGAQLTIGDHVEFKRGVEIRSHGSSKVILANRVRIDRGVRILGANAAVIELQEGVRVGLYSVLNGGDSIFVGKKSLISGFVYLQTSMHGHQQRTAHVQDQGYTHAAIRMEEDTWLGAHVVVLPGVTIGRGAVVGSNAVVTRSVEPYKVVGGVPAKEIKERNL